MRRADRLFDIIQRLRTARQPLTAAAIAEPLEVTVRTVYRDIAALQARRVPIEGAAGIGYVLRRGFDLPPLMFTAEELDAIVTGVRLVRRLRDPKLQEAADSVLAKVTTVLPEALRGRLLDAPMFVSSGSTPAATGVDLTEVRSAIHASR
jgi:predicted DNA-binding transcriptional regulator YafY